MTTASDIPVRRMDFTFPDDMDLVFIEGNPRTSFFFLGSWMMLPYLEPFLIRTMQAALPKISDPTLAEELRRFCMQEGQHFRQHAKANAVVKRVHPSGPRLAALEREVEALFARWSETKPLRFCLAYAEGFESMTSAGARTQIELDVFREMKEPIRSLMLWHIMEELEHRTVAFEVYENVVGSYLYRLVVGLWAQMHYLGLCRKFTRAMVEADPETVARHDGPDARRLRRQAGWTYLKMALPRQLATYLPWYNPRKLPMPERFEAVRRSFSDAAASVQ
ncbi:MAG: metal-dependent hydrolase [Alphaproteobacteria bacterium]|nr:metal-dependent hydrolase [Alphaproteobacteria bacterium]